MASLALFLIAVPIILVAYAYGLYPVLLAMIGRFRRQPQKRQPGQWPSISISVPVYNEKRQVRELIESLLMLDYPKELRQILIISDASDDGTDEVVKEYEHAGIELLRMPMRGGKTAGENAARAKLRGEIIVNTDASIRIPPHSIKPLIAALADPSVGVASGRDVSMALIESGGNIGESGYVGYEMTVRDLESRVYGIVGSSGCLYAIRRELHQHVIPEALARDFASALTAKKYGYRAVSVKDAICYVPRGPSIQREYRRKVRTMTRGLETLAFRAELLNPFRHGLFSWMLFSHKLCRWLVPWTGVVGLAGVILLGFSHPIGALLLPALAVLALLAAGGWYWPEAKRVPRLLAIPAFLLAANVAALHAWIRAVRGELDPVWEPTRRDGAQVAASATS